MLCPAVLCCDMLRFCTMNTNSGLEGAAVLEMVLLAIFCCDILVSFRVGYYDKQGLLVLESGPVALHYMRWARIA